MPGSATDGPVIPAGMRAAAVQTTSRTGQAVRTLGAVAREAVSVIEDSVILRPASVSGHEWIHGYEDTLGVASPQVKPIVRHGALLLSSSELEVLTSLRPIGTPRRHAK